VDFFIKLTCKINAFDITTYKKKTSNCQANRQATAKKTDMEDGKQIQDNNKNCPHQRMLDMLESLEELIAAGLVGSFTDEYYETQYYLTNYGRNISQAL